MHLWDVNIERAERTSDICADATFHDGSATCLDHALARDLEGAERRYAREECPDALRQIADAIRTRYDLTDASDAETVQDSGGLVTERVRL